MTIQLPNNWNAGEAQCTYVGLCNDNTWEITIRFYSEGIAAGAARVEIPRTEIPIAPEIVDDNKDLFLQSALQVLNIKIAE